MWNGLRSQEALEGGVFSRKAFIDVGQEGGEGVPYIDKKLVDRDAWKGKQFGVAATRTGNHPKDFFDPTVKPLFEGDVFVDRMPRELQPEKPGKGFLTSDYSKRDEFSLTIRSEQYHQQIKHEARVQKAAEGKLEAARGGSLAASGSASGAGEKKAEAPLLFDLIYNGEPALCIKAKRDTRNPTVLSKERRPGPWKTHASLTHTAPPAVHPPEYGIRRVDFT